MSCSLSVFLRARCPAVTHTLGLAPALLWFPIRCEHATASASDTLRDKNACARRFQSLRQNVFFGVVPKADDRRKGPPRNQCHSELAIAHARGGFMHVSELSNEHCDGKYAWDNRLLAYQVRLRAWHDGGDGSESGC